MYNHLYYEQVVLFDQLENFTFFILLLLHAETIYVRAYTHRIDLLRAVIIGPTRTPYADGLFFFDVCFPSNYPISPPVCHPPPLTLCARPYYILYNNNNEWMDE